MTRLHHVNVVVPPGATDEAVPFYELLRRKLGWGEGERGGRS